MKNLSRSEILRKLPAEFLKRLQEQFGSARFEQILRGFQAARLPVLRINPLAGDPEETLRSLRAQNIILQKLPELPLAFQVRNRNEKALLETTEAKSGRFLLQGFSSQLPVVFLDPQQGERIWDMCAAPGSKTSQIAALTANQSEIVASEKDTIRFQKLQNTLEIQKCSSVRAHQTDAIQFSKEFENYFDAVLLDAPCSAEGRIDLKNPASYRFWSQKNIVAHAKLQRQLFRAAAKCLKLGGRLVYSTCTLAPEENSGIVRWALEEFQETLEPIRIKNTFPFLISAENSGYILPDEKMEGFFVAIFKKRI